MFGIIIDEKLVFAPDILELDGCVHYHPTDEMYMSQGFLPIVETPCPEDDKYYTANYIEQNGEIVKVWSETESEPIESAPTLDERVTVVENELKITNAFIGIDEAEWKQPDSTNPYMMGDRVLYGGKVFESVIDNNVWSPKDYPQGWKEVSQSQ